MKARGVLEALYPLPAWETVPPADPFRIFERGGRNIISQFPEIGLPDALGQLQRLEEPGRPDIRQSNRGPGTGVARRDPGAQHHQDPAQRPVHLVPRHQRPARRLPHLGLRLAATSSTPTTATRATPAPTPRFGHWGTTQTADPTIPKDEPGHPLQHEFTRAIPSSQCMICHMHQPNMFVNTFLGYTMWDYESDAPLMWPKQELNRSLTEQRQILDRNPEAAAVRGLWGDVEFLSKVWTDVNPKAKDTQFADYHGHGWNFRAVYKRDRKGHLLDAARQDRAQRRARQVQARGPHVLDPRRRRHAVRRLPLRPGRARQRPALRRGRGRGRDRLQGLPRHGPGPTRPCAPATRPPRRRAPTSTLLRTPDGRRRFEWKGNELYQRSMVDPKLEWRMSLVKDTVDPASDRLQRQGRAREADGQGHDHGVEPGRADQEPRPRRRLDDLLHLPHLVDHAAAAAATCRSRPTGRRRASTTRAASAATSPPTTRRSRATRCSSSGKHSTVKGNIIAPVRSSSALVLSSTNINRERIYVQQPPISASGYSSQAFAPHYPHTERKTETKTCTDCHLSENNDNNAIMAQLLLHGTNFVNFVGFNAWVGEAGGIEAVSVTEWDEPQAVIGSYLHRYAYPSRYEAHQKARPRAADLLRPERRPRPAACSCAASTSWRPRAAAA